MKPTEHFVMMLILWRSAFY